MNANDSTNPELSQREEDAPYDAIAEWYDCVVHEGRLRHEGARSALLELVGDVRDQRICDLACGQGVIARELAARGAIVVGVDHSTALLDIAQQHGCPDGMTIEYIRDDAQHLQAIDDAAFDGVVCNLALMDIPDLVATLRSVDRILRPGGWFVSTITHPCFQAPHSDWVEFGGKLVRVIGDYNIEGFWRSDDPETARGRIGAQHRTISTYLNSLIAAGLSIVAVREPVETPDASDQATGWTDLPLALIVRCEKSSG